MAFSHIRAINRDIMDKTTMDFGKGFILNRRIVLCDFCMGHGVERVHSAFAHGHRFHGCPRALVDFRRSDEMKRKLTALLLAMTFVFATVAPTVANGPAKASENKTATVSVEKSKDRGKVGAFFAKLLPGNKDKAEKETKVAGARKALKAPGTSQEDPTGDKEEKDKFDVYFCVRNKDDDYLEGATLRIVKDTDQSVVEEWSSARKPNDFSLESGSYSFLQWVPARGYKQGEPVHFTITDLGKVEVKDAGNNLKEFNGKDMLVIEAEKQDGKIFYGIVDHSGKRVAGAKIQIKEKDSEEASYAWTSDGGFKDYILPPGDYVLLQSEALEGFEKADPIEFTIDKDKKISTKSDRLKTSDSTNDQYLLLEAKEAKKETGKLLFSLRGIDDNELAGAKFEIKKDGKKLEEIFETKDLPYELPRDKGEYELTVTHLPDGYKLEKDTIKFEIKEDGKLVPAEADKGNVEAKDGNQTLFMVAERLGDRIYFGLKDSNGQALSGLELKIEGNNGKVINLVSGERSIGVKVTELSDGDYVFLQTNVRYGHEAAEPIRFTVKDHKIVQATYGLENPFGLYQELTLVSKIISNNSVKRVVTFSRVDSLGKFLLGTEIEIYKEGTKIASWKSGSDNHKLELEAGVYKYHEASIVLGHKIAKDFEFEVKADGSIILKGVQLGEVVKLKEGGHICVGEPTSKPVEDPNKKPGENSGQKPTTDTKTQAKNHWVEFNVAKKDGTLLDGAVVEIYKNGKLLESWTTSTTGYKTQLEPGTYRFHTKTAPQGYQLARDFNFAVNRDGSIKLGRLQSGDTVTAKEGKIIVYGDPVSATGARINTTGTTSAAPGNGRLPKTGDGISPVVYAVGLAAVGAVILGIGIKKRRESVDEVK